MEINFFVVIFNEDVIFVSVYFLDLVVKFDQIVDFECGVKWVIVRLLVVFGIIVLLLVNGFVNIDVGFLIEFFVFFGCEFSKEEVYIVEFDVKIGVFFKFIVFNFNGRIWILVVGGGVFVVYVDVIVFVGFVDEFVNYGEYFGVFIEFQIYYYVCIVFDFMFCVLLSDKGKVLFIGGGIVNFINVVFIFKGVIKVFREYVKVFNEYNVQIWVCCVGFNYQEGFKNMKVVI